MTNHSPMNASFPVLDSDRVHDHDERRRVIFDCFGYVDPYIDETDSYISMPLRLVHDAAAGWHIELGPYSLSGNDIAALQRAIDAWRQATAPVDADGGAS